MQEHLRRDLVHAGIFDIDDGIKLVKKEYTHGDIINDDINIEDIIDSTMKLLRDILNFHSDLVSTYAANYTLGRVFERVRKEYGNPPVFLDILLSLPKGVLEDRKQTVLNKELLEARVRERVTYLSQAFLRAKEATDEKIAIVNTIIDPLVVVGSDNAVKTINPAFEKIFGYPRKTMINTNIEKGLWASEMDTNERDTLFNTIREAFRHGKFGPVELYLPHNSGKKIPVTLTASATPYHESESDIILLFRDISKLKKRERELKILDIAIENSINAVCIINTEKDLIYVNNAFLDMFMYDEKSIALKKSLDSLLIMDGNQNVEFYDFLFGNSTWMGEVCCKRVNGEIFDAFMVTSLVEDENKTPISCMISLLDISDRKAAEDWKDFLHSLLTHDVGNKLQIIQGYIQLILDMGLDGDMERMARKQLETADATIRLIDRVRLLREVESESGEGSTNPFFILQEVVNAYTVKAKEKGINIIFDDKLCEAKVRSDSQGGTLIESIFSNLIDNAIKHSGCSNINVSIEEKANYIVVTIEDDGIGFEKRSIEQLEWDKIPRSGHKNLGLRLITVSVKKIGGYIDISSSENEGAKFEVFLVKRYSES